MAYLVLLPAVILLLVVALALPWFGTPEQDERCDRLDRDLDRDYPPRRIGGWRI